MSDPDGLRRRLAETVAALRKPASYLDCDPVAEGVTTIEAIETHMAWVFLTPRRAYKLLKPIATPLFDHTTLAARRRGCEAELALNRRLAASVYLRVVPVVADGSGGVRVGARVGGATGSEPLLERPSLAWPILAWPIWDWLVEMRRLPRARMLDALIGRAGGVTIADIDALADRLTGFFLAADPVEESGEQYRVRVAADIASKRADLARPRYGLERGPIDAVYAALQEWLRRHGAALEARAGRLIDGHGDLRPEHVCLEQPPVVIDCLAFSARLRAVDPASELAFLGLECRRLGAAWVGERLLEHYLDHSRDLGAAEMVGFYAQHHALVRAAIAVWHLDDDGFARPGSDPERWRAKARRYLELALTSSEPHRRR